jgi:elongation factor P
MVEASKLRGGMAVRFEGQLYKVIAADYHPGQGKMGGATHARLKNLTTGTLWEHSFRAELKLEEVPVEKRPMEFLYADGENCCFMDPNTADQVEVPTAMVGQHANFLQPEMIAAVEFIDGAPVSVEISDVLEIGIADTAPPAHSGGNDNTWKLARLANGIEIMVPQFIKSGDTIRLDLHTIKYMDRVKK